jgi:hypothetical protein
VEFPARRFVDLPILLQHCALPRLIGAKAMDDELTEHQYSPPPVGHEETVAISRSIVDAIEHSLSPQGTQAPEKRDDPGAH